jgi:hypothetical protein
MVVDVTLTLPDGNQATVPCQLVERQYVQWNMNMFT